MEVKGLPVARLQRAIGVGHAQVHVLPGAHVRAVPPLALGHHLAAVHVPLFGFCQRTAWGE